MFIYDFSNYVLVTNKQTDGLGQFYCSTKAGDNDGKSVAKGDWLKDLVGHMEKPACFLGQSLIPWLTQQSTTKEGFLLLGWCLAPF